MKKVKTILGIVIPFLLMITAALIAYNAIQGTAERNAIDNAEIIERSIRNASLTCYCEQGAYPSDFEYLKEHYAINVDTTKYIVYYRTISSNIMPEIKVIVKGAGV